MKLVCPCGSGVNYNACCKPIHANHACADTPEQIMRARYTAHVYHKHDFLLATWAREKRPVSLDSNTGIKWLALEILKTEYLNDSNTEGIVLFEAVFLESSNLCRLIETSTFISRSQKWYYLTGDSEIISEQVTSNRKCPCGSGKKFKRCCKTF